MGARVFVGGGGAQLPVGRRGPGPVPGHAAPLNACLCPPACPCLQVHDDLRGGLPGRLQGPVRGQGKQPRPGGVVCFSSLHCSLRPWCQPGCCMAHLVADGTGAPAAPAGPLVRAPPDRRHGGAGGQRRAPWQLGGQLRRLLHVQARSGDHRADARLRRQPQHLSPGADQRAALLPPCRR